MNNLRQLIKKKTPVWFMRQAGRYLPEYRHIRKKEKSFIDLCFNSSLAAEISLQPIKRFDFDFINRKTLIKCTKYFRIPDCPFKNDNFGKDNEELTNKMLSDFQSIFYDSMKR